MRYTLSIVGLVLGLLILIGGCDRPVITVDDGMLDFNVDTVKFDSIFTGFHTPSERLIAINPSGNNVNVKRIWLNGGENSEFMLIIDGVETDDREDQVIPSKDSIHIFVALRSELKDNYAEDYVNFQIGDDVQQVLIRAFVVDAYLFRTVIRNDSLFPAFVCDTVFTPDKPIIVDGPLFIPEGCKLEIMPGTHLYFTPFKYEFNLFSMLYVQGTLDSRGTPDNPIIMEGTRLEYNYFEQPGQWRGIRFTPTSDQNKIEHTLIKNALVGVQIDSTSIGSGPKVEMRFSRIRNMAAYGVLGLGYSPNTAGTPPMILMENSLVNNCKIHTVAIAGGGNYEFYNCTLGNESPSFSRRDPSVLVNNYFEDENEVVFPFDCRARFINCAIWGNEEHEILIDEGGANFDLLLDHCLVRQNTEDFDYSQYYNEVKINQDPLFYKPGARTFDYRPEEGSPLINAGIDLSSRYVMDIRGRLDSTRYDGYEIGAYEYWEIEDE